MGSMPTENFAPSFTKKPKLRQEDDGNKLVFECQLVSSPKPDIEWFRGDVPVTKTPRISITVTPASKNAFDVQLIIDDVEEEDEGLYKIKAKNKFGEVAASINLNFSPTEQLPALRQIDGRAPTFGQKPTIKQDDSGKNIKFECRILADPKPTVTWFRDGEVVQESSRCSLTISKDEEDNSYFVVLSLKRVTVEDAGKYKVTGKNELGESSATISLNFDSSFMKQTGDESPDIPDGVKPTFTERPSIRQSEDLSCVTFSCRCAGSPKPKFRWEFQGKKLSTSSRHKMKVSEEGKIYYNVEMEILKVATSDEGEYKAFASNDLGEGVATINLNFDGKTASDKPKIPDGKAPRFPKKPVIRQEGDKLIMECLLEAYPEPEITWFKGNQIIHEQGRISMYKKVTGKDQYLISIVINNPKSEDGGNWRVNAFNPVGDSNANIALNFKEGQAVPEGYAPTFLDKPSIIPNESGTMITMKVRCKAKPEPTVEWFKDGVKIEEQKRLQIKMTKVSNEMFEYSCIVKEPTASDAGKYKCVAMNQFGEATANVNLNIESEPEPEGQGPEFIEKPKIKWEEGASKVIMEAVVKSDPKPVSKWTKGGVVIETSSKCTASVVKQSGKSVYLIQLELRRPQPADGGLYKCNIKNEFGELNANLNLNIEVAPTIKKPPVIRSVVNRKVTLECIVMSTSKPACTWIKESTKIKQDSKHGVSVTEVSEGKYKVNLEITKAERNDCGTYKVLAKNEKGETTSQTVELTEKQIDEEIEEESEEEEEMEIKEEKDEKKKDKDEKKTDKDDKLKKKEEEEQKKKEKEEEKKEEKVEKVKEKEKSENAEKKSSIKEKKEEIQKKDEKVEPKKKDEKVEPKKKDEKIEPKKKDEKVEPKKKEKEEEGPAKKTEEISSKKEEKVETKQTDNPSKLDERKKSKDEVSLKKTEKTLSVDSAKEKLTTEDNSNGLNQDSQKSDQSNETPEKPKPKIRKFVKPPPKDVKIGDTFMSEGIKLKPVKKVQKPKVETPDEVDLQPVQKDKAAEVLKRDSVDLLDYKKNGLKEIPPKQKAELEKYEAQRKSISEEGKPKMVQPSKDRLDSQKVGVNDLLKERRNSLKAVSRNASPRGSIVDAPRIEVSNELSERRSSLKAVSRDTSRRGSLIPPEEQGRRPSLLIPDESHRKLRPGEVVDETKVKVPTK